MRVLILSHYFPPEVGAPQTRLRETALGLQRLGHQVTVLTGPPHYPGGVVRPGYAPWRVQREWLDGIRVVRVPVVVRPNRGLIDRSIDQLTFMATSAMAHDTVKRADVVLVESPPLFLGLTATLYRHAYGVNYLFHVADPWPDYPIQMRALRNRMLIRVARWIESVAYQNATLVTTVSPGLVRRLDRHPEANGKARLLLNGVDVDRFLPDRAPASARAELGWPDAALTLVYVGSVGLAQGVDTLIAAVEPLAASGVLLHIVGEGFDHDRLARDVADRGLHHIRFAGPVALAAVPGVLAAADAVLVMLRPGILNWHSLPTKLVEGLAAGRPVVVSADGDAAEIVNGAGAGVSAAAGDAVALRNAILALLDPTLRAEMGSRGRRVAVERYDRKRSVEVLNGYLEEVVSRGRPRSIRRS
jgi:glycosyltransferase involved in cell wall biosynthesis